MQDQLTLPNFPVNSLPIPSAPRCTTEKADPDYNQPAFLPEGLPKRGELWVDCRGGSWPSSPTRLDLDSTIQVKPVVAHSINEETVSDARPVPCCGGFLKNKACGSMIRLACKKWTCPKCTRKKGAELCKRIKASGNQEKLNRLITLPFALSSERGWREALSESGCVLNRFLTSLRGIYPGLLYLWTREIGSKSNMVHFHMLVNRYIPKQLLSTMWERAGGGRVVDIGIVRAGISYALKYLMKVPNYPREVQDALFMKRRYSTSRRLLAPRAADKLIGDWLYLTVALGCSEISEGKWRSEDGVIFTSITSGPS